MQQEVRRHEANWAQAHVLYGLKVEAEKKFAVVLQEIHDRIGKEEWLKQIKVEFGWGQAAAYQHMDPDGMAKARERQGVLNKIPHNVESQKEVEPREEEQEEPFEEYEKKELMKQHEDTTLKCLDLIGAAAGCIKLVGVDEVRKLYHTKEHEKRLASAKRLLQLLTQILTMED